MTVQRPDLTPDELRDARDAWMLSLLGQPIPALYRPAAAKAAGYAVARAYDHDDTAGARPVFLHPDGGAEGHPGVYGVNRTWTAPRLAAWIEENTKGVREKGTGPMYSPGHSWRGDDHDPDGAMIAGAYPMAPLQRGDDRCRSLGWLFLDADASGDWHTLSDVLGAQGAAFVRSRSSGHCPGSDCPAHPEGAVKWHLALPLRETWEPSGDLNLDRARWKSELYASARFALHLAGDLSGRGFDRELAQFLCRFYVGSPRDAAHIRVAREVVGRDGLGFDVEACLLALEDLGVVDPAPVRAARTAGQFAPGRAWDLDDGTPPMVAAFLVAGLYGRQLSNGNHAVVCPWEALHSGGEALDTSTILFPNGKFHCSHSHAEGKAADGEGMREVLSMLPPDAQAAHEEARRQGRAKLEAVPAWMRPGGGAAAPCTDEGAERDVLRGLARDDWNALPAKPGDPPRAWQRVAALLQESDFADAGHASVFAAMGRAKAAGKPLIAAVLRDELRAGRAAPAVVATAGDLAAFDKANRKVGTFEAAQPKHADTKDEKGNVVPGTVFAFPPYQHVATAPTVGGERRRQGFNAGYLSDVALVAAAAANPRTLGVTFYPGEGELDAGIFVTGKWTVYIMPMRTGDESAPKSKRGKASQPAQDAPSAAIVLAGGPVDVATVETPQNAKGAPSVIVLDTRPVNAASLGSDLAPIALLAARKASREREWRETFAITAETPREVLAAWVEDAA